MYRKKKKFRYLCFLNCAFKACFRLNSHQTETFVSIHRKKTKQEFKMWIFERKFI